MVYHKDLLEEIRALPVIDTCVRLDAEQARISKEADFFGVFMSAHTCNELSAAGMPRTDMAELLNANTSHETKVRLFMPYWQKCSNTAYFRAQTQAVNDIYNIPEITAETLPELSARISQRNKPGVYAAILQDVAHISQCVTAWRGEPLKPFNKSFYKVSLCVDDILSISDASDINRLEQQHGIFIRSLYDFSELIERMISSIKDVGLCAIFSTPGAFRTLEFEYVTDNEAALSLERILTDKTTDSDVKNLQDFLMYSLAQTAYWHNLVFQIHTGISSGGIITPDRTNPLLLSRLLNDRPDTVFDILIGGIPFGDHALALAKTFPNVYINLTLAHTIASRTAVRFLTEWLHAIPAGRIIGFGSDATVPEDVYASLCMARDNITRALCEWVADDEISRSTAISYARMLLYDNPAELFPK